MKLVNVKIVIITQNQNILPKTYQEISKLTPTKFFILRLSNLFGYPMNDNKSCWNLFINNI